MFSLKIIRVVLTGLLFVQVARATESQSYFQIAQVTVKEVPTDLTNEVYAVKALMRTCERSNTAGDVHPSIFLHSGLTDLFGWGDIINLGLKLWSIVQEGEPVANVQTSYATALPRGVSCWMDMENWRAPEIKTFQVQYYNLLGMNVVDFTYSLVAVSGGQYQGRGAYIAHATVVPVHLSVLWGFGVDASATVHVVFNTGTQTDPVAAMQVQVGWSVKSIFTSEQRTAMYYLNGQGLIQEMKD